VLSLRTGRPHPLCAASNGIVSIPAPAEWVLHEAHYTRVQLAGTALLVLFADRSRCASVLCDWRVGHVLAFFTPPPVPIEHNWTRVASTLALLSSEAFVHGTYNPATHLPAIQVYALVPLPAPELWKDDVHVHARLNRVKVYELPLLHAVTNARLYFSPFEAGKTHVDPSVSNDGHSLSFPRNRMH
jgi:hypothetical protein